jgi:SSS family solute:Na+ symporter
MAGKIYSLIIFLTLFWVYCLYCGFKNYKKTITPVDFFIYGRNLPSWVYIIVATGTIFSCWIFFIQPSLILLNGFPYASTSLSVISVSLIGILFLKKQWMLSKKFGFVTPAEMMATYLRSDLIRILIVVLGIGFAIPFIAMQLSLAGIILSILTDNIIGSGSASLLIGSVIIVYLSLSGIRSLIYVDTVNFLFTIFGIVALGFIAYDLVGGWGLLNESLSRISNIKENLFNIKESYNSYLNVPGTVKMVEILDSQNSYGGIWTSSMILTFAFAISGIIISPSFSMLAFSNREVKSFGTQQVWFSSFLIGFVLIFFTAAIGSGSIFLGSNDLINQTGNNISNVLPNNISPNNLQGLVPHLINVIGEYSPLFFGLLLICGIASLQSASIIYISTSALLTRDILKRFFIQNMNNNDQIFAFRIILMLVFIVSLVLSIQTSNSIFDLGSFALSIACQMFVPLIAICYLPWLTKNGIAFGIIVGIITVIFTEHIGQIMFQDLIKWEKWPLTFHSAFWGLLFNFISAISISFITQDSKEKNHKSKIHEFLNEHKSLSMNRRSLKPSAWIVTVTWLFFALGPGTIIGNEMFGNPNNVESWSFGIPSIWVWQIIFWLLGIILVWFLAFKMEMSTPPDKNINSQTEDIGGRS